MTIPNIRAALQGRRFRGAGPPMALPRPQAMGTVGVFWGGLCSRAVHRVLPSCVCRMRQVACHVVDGKWRGVQAFLKRGHSRHSDGHLYQSGNR